MKILWASKLQMDIALDIVTWEAMTRELALQGIDIKILVFGKDNEKRFQNRCIEVPIIPVKYLRILSFYIYGYLYFNFHFLKFRPNVVMCNIFSIFFLFPIAVLLKRKWGVKFVLDNRTLYFDDLEKSVSQRFSFYLSKLAFTLSRRICDGITVINEFLAKEVSKHVGMGVDQIGIWSSGVDPEFFTPLSHSRPKWMKDKFVIMQHGGLSYNRGLVESVEAMAKIKNDKIMLVLVGRGVAEKELIRRICSLNLYQRVKIIPPVSFRDVPRVINMADAAVLAYPNTTYWKGNVPIKLLEYMAMEKPIICTNISTFGEILQDSPACIYIDDNKPACIVRGIQLCFDKFDELKKCSKRNREIVLKDYTWTRQAEKLLDYLKKL